MCPELYPEHPRAQLASKQGVAILSLGRQDSSLPRTLGPLVKLAARLETGWTL